MKRGKMKGFVLRVQGEYVGMVFADRVERIGSAKAEQMFAWFRNRIVFSAGSSPAFRVELVEHDAPRANGRPEQPAASAVESHSEKESGSSDV